MYTLKDHTEPRHFEHTADPVHAPASLASSWAQGRSRLTPWAYPHMRALGALRIATGILLAGGGAMFFAYGQWRWAPILLIGAALNLSIGFMDTTAARFASPRS